MDSLDYYKTVMSELFKKETEESTSNSEDKIIDYNFPKFERSELIDTSQTQIFK